MTWQLPTTFNEWERKLVTHFLMTSSAGDASPLKAIEVTPTTLAIAVGAPETMESEVADEFRRMLRSDEYLNNALSEGLCRRPIAEIPNYYCYLALSLLVDSLLDGEYSAEGAYRRRLEAWLGTNRTYQNLRGIALMWERLAKWLKVKADAGEPYRRLILPQSRPTWTHIGYSRQLSFPNRRDIRQIQGLFKSHPEAKNGPLPLIRAFDGVVNQISVSDGLSQAYSDFRAAYFNHTRALSSHRFWKLVQRSAISRTVTPAHQVSIELVFLRETRPSFFVSDEKNVKSTFDTFDDLAANQSIATSQNFRIAFSLGIVIFVQAGTARWQATSNAETLPARVLVAVEKSRWTYSETKLGTLVKGKRWSITAEPVARRKLAEVLDYFGIRSKISDVLFHPMISGGIRVGSAWLGRAGFLPAISADGGTLIADCLDGQVNESIQIAGTRFTTSSTVSGRYSIHPTVKEAEQDIPWRIEIKFQRDALVHQNLQCRRSLLETMSDWESAAESSVRYLGTPDLDWDDTPSTIADLLEAIYADGRIGWPEDELVSLVLRADLSINPWELLRWFHENAVLQPRLRDKWRGRDWTLVEPQVIRLLSNGEDIYLIEGALCKQQIEDFRSVVLGAGGHPFKRPGHGSVSYESIGAIGLDGETITSKLGWPVIQNPASHSEGALALIASKRLAESYDVADTWDWSQRRFVPGSHRSTGLVDLLRLCHPSRRDHDVYRVRGAGTISHHISRNSAIIAAHAAAKISLFQQRDGLLIRTSKEGGLPDMLARHLRRKTLTSSGFVGGVFAYPCMGAIGDWVARLLPGCVALRERKVDPSMSDYLKPARTGWQHRPTWDGSKVLW